MEYIDIASFVTIALFQIKIILDIDYSKSMSLPIYYQQPNMNINLNTSVDHVNLQFFDIYFAVKNFCKHISNDLDIVPLNVIYINC